MYFLEPVAACCAADNCIPSSKKKPAYITLMELVKGRRVSCINDGCLSNGCELHVHDKMQEARI